MSVKYSYLTKLARSLKYGLSNSFWRDDFHDSSILTSMSHILHRVVEYRSMQIQLSFEKIDPEDDDKEMVFEKLAGLDKLLTSFEEDLKQAKVVIIKGSRWGFEVKFDMQLPGKHIFASETGEELVNVVVAVREDVERQIKEYVQKLRGE